MTTCVTGRNRATDSENRIHDDVFAARYGFRGGLVPGVTVYGYLCAAIAEVRGEGWLANGGIRIRFLQPVYDGDEITLTVDEATATAARGGAVCAAADIYDGGAAAPSPDEYTEASLPAMRPPASAESLAVGSILGTLRTTISESTPEGLLTLSNYLLMQNVELGPWIHAGSDVHNFNGVASGAQVAVRGRVADLFERKSRPFVVLETIVIADGQVIQQVRHTAIYKLPLSIR